MQPLLIAWAALLFALLSFLAPSPALRSDHVDLTMRRAKKRDKKNGRKGPFFSATGLSKT